MKLSVLYLAHPTCFSQFLFLAYLYYLYNHLCFFLHARGVALPEALLCYLLPTTLRAVIVGFTFADAPRNKYQESQMPGFVGSLLFSLYFLLFWAKCHLQLLLTILVCLSLGSIYSGFPGPSEPALFYNIHVQCCPYQTSYLKLITKIVLSWTRPHFGSFKVN